jgi:hypothetical protein
MSLCDYLSKVINIYFFFECRACHINSVLRDFNSIANSCAVYSILLLIMSPLLTPTYSSQHCTPSHNRLSLFFSLRHLASYQQEEARLDKCTLPGVLTRRLLGGREGSVVFQNSFVNKFRWNKRRILISECRSKKNGLAWDLINYILIINVIFPRILMVIERHRRTISINQ